MRLSKFAVVLSILFIITKISANESETEVVILTDSNFDELTAKGKWLIEFYAPWCGHCKKLEPIFDEASLLLKKDNTGLFLGKVDCTVESGLANRFNIRGYPTLKYIRSGIDTPYEGGRTLQAITEFAKRVTRPAVDDVNENNYQKFLLDNSVAFLLVGGSEIASDVFQTVAAKLQDSVTFGKAPSSFKSKFNTQQDSFMVLLNDDEPEVYQGGFTEEELVAYVMKNRFPLFGQLAAHNFYSVVNNGKLTVIAVVDPNDEQTKPYLDTMKNVAKSNKNRFSFGYLDGVEFHQFAARYGIHKIPNFFVYDGTDSSYRETDVITGPHTAQAINAFLDDVLAGKIESKGAGGLDQVIRLVKNNIVWVGAGLVVLIASIIFCCCLPSGEEEKETKKD